MREPNYLREVQYRDSSNLSRRADLHAKYATNPVNVYDWFSALVPWPPRGGRLLEIGCGPGWMWPRAARQLPGGLRLTLTDLSDGMVRECRPRVAESGAAESIHAAVCSAEALAFAEGAFDVALSTFMLYHVPDRETAVRELARVLGPDGVLGIITVGSRHLAEIQAIRQAVFGEAGRFGHLDAFRPEIATPWLEAAFEDVEWHRYDDVLDCAEPEDVMGFLGSSPPACDANEAQRRQMRALVDAGFAAGGGRMTITKDVSAFICRGPRLRRLLAESQGSA